MGGLDDVIDEADDDADKRKVQNIADKLGVEDKEELENLDDRLDDAYEMVIEYDRRIEKLEEQVSILTSAVNELLNDDSSSSDDRSSNEDEQLREQDDETNSSDGLEWN